MKTQIIQLEPHDDIVSTRDKMGWGGAARILLVWPERGRILTRRLDLVLLQRRSKVLGAQLALVTNDPKVRFNALDLAIPVYKSLRKAQNIHWRLPRRLRVKAAHGPVITPRPRGSLPPRPPRPGKLPPTVRLFSFTLGVLALLSMAAVLSPQAEVVLVPETRQQEVTYPVHASPRLSDVQLSGGVPARPVAVVVEGRDSRPASGSVQIPHTHAAGRVQFTNLTDETVTIPPGIIVRTVGKEPVRFATTQAGDIPILPGAEALIPVRAVAPGPDGNLPKDSLRAIEGTLGTQVMVSNLQPTSGGAERRQNAPSQADRQKLAGSLTGALQATAMKEIQATIKPGDLLLASQPELVQVISEEYEPAELLPADRLQLSLRLEFQVLVVSAEDLQALAGRVLDASLPSGYTPLPGTLSFEHVTSPQAGADGIARWTMLARRQIQAEVTQAQAVALSLGGSPEQVRSRLAQFLPLQAEPVVNVIPAWWPRLPLVPFRISVELADQAQQTVEH